MLLPEAAAKAQAKEAKEKEMGGMSSAEVRRRALEALEGKRSPSLGGGNGWMNATEASKESEKKVVLPDLDDDDAVVEVDGKSCPLLPFFADISENNAYFQNLPSHSPSPKLLRSHPSPLLAPAA
jgi:hypothetical protein